MEASARFDDGRMGTSFQLSGFRGSFTAWEAESVPSVLAEAVGAARDGWWVAGWVTYEAAPGFDPSLSVDRSRRASDPLGPLPLAWFGVFEGRAPAPELRPVSSLWTLDIAPADHRGAVDAIRERIREGVTYQVNLTARSHGTVSDPGGLYRRLVEAQRGAYSALLVTGEHAVACASPELFFELEERCVRSRPMKGTARRGRWAEEDAAAAAQLAASAKEQAENVMIVDLVRNDIGRVAEYGSVHVPALFEVEAYPTVWQLTSTVEGRLRSDVGVPEVFTALFPAGSVTGAPKRAAMDVIVELESGPRGVYCGAVGFVEPGGRRARFAVAIRTATTNLATGYTEYGAGGGITWASEPDAEWRELEAKAGILDGLPPIGGLFETFAAGSPNLAAHLRRLATSAERFGIPFDDAEAAALAGGAEGRVRLELRPDGALSVASMPLPATTEEPVRLAVCTEVVRSDDIRLFHKTIDREQYERCRATRADVDDVVLVNERGEVTETTIANIAVCIGGQWWTPPLASGLLPGVERARRLDDGTVRERVIHEADLRGAEAVAVLSSLRGWRPAVVVP